MTPADLARAVRCLAPDRRSPEAFHIARDQIAHAIARMDAGQPCASCRAHRLRVLLAQAQVALRRQREALAQRDRLLRQACRPPVRRRHGIDPRQLALPSMEPSP